MVEATRWLFAVLTVVSVVLGLAGTADGGPTTLVVALVASATLVVSVIVVYARQRVSLTGELMDAPAITVMSLVSRDPSVTLGVVFASIWFRSLYDGSKWRSVARCVLYATALASSVVLWSDVPWHTGGTDVGRILGVFPTMFLTVIVARHLARLLDARERAFRRDAVQTALGSRLLALKDAAEIREAAWEAVNEICDATPELRVLKAVRDGGALRVENVSRSFLELPVTIPSTVVDSSGSVRLVGDPVVHRSVELDAAAGVTCDWICVPLPEVPDQHADAWLIVGSPAASLPEAAECIRGVVNQVVMALRNSETHHSLTVLATRDSLTGLANRAAFNTALTKRAERSAPTAHRAAVHRSRRLQGRQRRAGARGG